MTETRPPATARQAAPFARRQRLAFAVLAAVVATPLLALVFPWPEAIGFTTGVLCVWLAAVSDPFTWPVAIVNGLLFFVVFWASGLFADSLLQLFYVAIAIYGIARWRSRAGEANAGAAAVRPVGRAPRGELLWLAGTAAAGIAALGWFLDAHTPSTVPWGDATTTVLSLVAQWMMSRRYVENWWLWIAADVLYIPLYLHKDLALTAALYGVFLLLCIQGLVRWTRDLREERRGSVTIAA